MCFTIVDKHKNEKTAKKDIPCYKITKWSYTPEFYSNREKYNKFKIYYAKRNGYKLERFNIIGNDTIYEGMHSYSVENKTAFNGLKAYEKFYSKYDSHRRVIYCIIPKGEKYYYNNSVHQYVSLSFRRIQKPKFYKLLSNKKGK